MSGKSDGSDNETVDYSSYLDRRALSFSGSAIDPNHFLTTLEVKNFKSIEQMTIHPKKVNVFLGLPNTGKSNILEIFNLFSTFAHYQFIRENIRLKSYDDLYFKKFLNRTIEIFMEFGPLGEEVPQQSDLEHQLTLEISELLGAKHLGHRIAMHSILGNTVSVRNHFGLLSEKGIYLSKIQELFDYAENIVDPNDYYFSSRKSSIKELAYIETFQRDRPGILDRFRFYRLFDFKLQQMNIGRDVSDEVSDPEEGPSIYQRSQPFITFKSLWSPGGGNFYDVINTNEYNQLLLRDILDKFDLKLNLNRASKRIEISEEDENGILITIPLDSLADTIQSLIFYGLAIKSNVSSIIALEEPEIHTYPIYSMRVAEMVAEDQVNQFFITTHNSHFVNSLIQKCGKDDLQIYIVQKKNNRTVVTALNDKQLEILNEDDPLLAISHFDEWKDVVKE